MRPLIQELSRYNKFSFENPPVGSKFLFHEPEEIRQTDIRAGPLGSYDHSQLGRNHADGNKLFDQRDM